MHRAWLLVVLATACAEDASLDASGASPEAAGAEAAPADLPSSSTTEPAEPSAGVAISGLPARCSARLHTGAMAPGGALGWAVCASARPGCERAVFPGAAPHDRITFQRPEPIRLVGGVPTIAFSRTSVNEHGSAARTETQSVQPLDGAPIIAVTRTVDPSDGCPVRLLFGEGGVALVGRTPEARFFASAGWSQPGAMAARVWELGALGAEPASRMVRGAVGVNELLVERREPDGVIAIDLRTGATSVADAPPIEHALAFRAGFLGLHTGASGGVVVWPTGERPRVIPPESNMVVTALAVDRSEGARLVWVEAVRQAEGFGPSSLRVADLERPPLAASPIVLSEPVELTRGDIVVNAGLALIVESPTSATVVRLGDGAVTRLATEPDSVFVRPLWIDKRHVWLSTAVASPGSHAEPESGIIRLDLRAFQR